MSFKQAFRLTSAASLVTVALGVLTNKILALCAGAEGVALIGIYRNLTGFLCNLLALEATTVVVQRISNASTDGEVRDAVRGAVRLFGLQALAMALLSVTAAGPVAAWLFGAAGRAHLTEVRVVLLMAIGVLALRLVTGLLSGERHLRAFTTVNVLTSALTLLTVYPLLLLGGVGLAMVIGLTCFVGAGVGAVFVARGYGLHLSDLRPARSARGGGTPASLWLTLRTLLVSGAVLGSQALISRRYGVRDLGLYSAASTLETTTVLVLMSAMRSYYLPQLGAVRDPAGQDAFTGKVLGTLLLLMLPVAALLIVLSRPLLGLLFSGAFAGAADVLGPLAVSMIAQTFVWCYAMFLLHKENNLASLLLDGAWAAAFLAGAALWARRGGSLAGIAWIYAGSFSISALLYTLTVRRLHRPGLLSRDNALLGPLCLLWAALGCALRGHGAVVAGAYLGATLSLVLWLARRSHATPVLRDPVRVQPGEVPPRVGGERPSADLSELGAAGR